MMLHISEGARGTHEQARSQGHARKQSRAAALLLSRMMGERLLHMHPKPMHSLLVLELFQHPDLGKETLTLLWRGHQVIHLDLHRV